LCRTGVVVKAVERDDRLQTEHEPEAMEALDRAG
jgi:hypothetical protein